MYYRKRKFIRRRRPYGRKRFRKFRRTIRRQGVPSFRSSRGHKPVIPDLSLPGVPKRCIARMRFSELYSSPVMTAGAMAQNSFKANSIINCKVTGGGTRDAFGMVQLSAIYNHWSVKGAKMRIEMVPTTSTTGLTAPVVYGVTTSDTNGGVYLSWQTFVEKRQGQWCINQVQEPYKKVFMSRWSARKWFSKET